MHVSTYAVKAQRIFDGDTFLEDRAILVRMEADKGSSDAPGACGYIEAIVPTGDLGDIPCYSFPQAHMAPAFVDVQINGCGGVMLADTLSEECLESMHRTNLRSGCTAFMPTLVSSSDAAMRDAMALVASYRARKGPAPIMGLHLEGPYISPERRGIHDARQIRPLDVPMRDAIAAFASQNPLLLTIAPECVEDADIRLLQEAGARISLGHSAASYERCMQAVAAGAVAVTHLYNAMPPLAGRQPGLLGAALDDSGLWCGIIADGKHVHASNVRLAWKRKKDRCFFVSDATAPAGLDYSANSEEAMASFSFCGQTVYVQDGACCNADGTLGGSMLTMIEALRYGITSVGIPEREALRMASLYPAMMMGQEQLFGYIRPGRVADMVVYDPLCYTVIATMDRGVIHQMVD